MKLLVPRLAVRRSIGEPIHSNVRPFSIPTFLHRIPAIPCHQHPAQWCTRRDISSAAPQTSTDGQNNSLTSTKPSSQTQPESSISEHVRLLMRRVPYPVAIITATDPAGPPDTTSFRGMTVSSFNTVTLTPRPVISFNVRRPSETLNALLASGRFLVHLLAPGPATATLARDFSKGNTTLATILSGHGEFQFEALNPKKASSQDTTAPLPLLRRRGAESCLPDSNNAESVDFPFVFECELHPQKIDVQDHSIVLGTVVGAIQGSVDSLSNQDCTREDSEKHLPDRLCLAYANARFWKMGSEL
ncbi:hypothetical protein N7462_007805 [Penicillium macrosclerotiorum]|uniref:uncharacterized protein n=1 Tax=Penicillium macrosclerotiorum TaxID=303699 RepID=UPI002547FDF7|nr:uncharacterized protein N7462_007805 [Penicillium macrosclerotiorum]KAJ5679561.1 hypothetical protein N7462_007805 [Penicillium macrosclerotiorum]